MSLPVGAAALPQVEWGDSDALLPADYAVAIGNPGDLDNIVTMGVVSGMIRPVTGGGVSTAFVMQSSRFHTGKHTLLDRSVSYIVTDAKVSGGMLCVCIYMCIHIYICTYICICIYIYLCVYV